jgi:biopolymer transport protein ExbD
VSLEEKPDLTGLDTVFKQQNDEDVRVMIEVEGAVDYAVVVAVIDAVRRAGVSKFAINVNQD